jgi:23S rRNA (uracil1939-C5)-methyltransferase
MPETTIESLDHEGRGVAHAGGKALFVDGALPGESVAYTAYKEKHSFDLAHVQAILRVSPFRVAPACPHFGVCGGCSMQHLDPRAQVAAKQRVLEDCLWHIARVRPQTMLSPMQGPTWRYRRRARLSVRLVRKKGGVLVGFHERKSSFVAEMLTCEILPAELSAAIPLLRRLVGSLSIRERLPQIEIAVGEEVTVLVLRVLQEPNAEDEALLRAFADQTGFQLWLQSKGPDSARPFWPLDAQPLFYSLPDFGLELHFLPTDFTQVNHELNRVLVRRAVRLLDPRPGERVADLFCGLGNFSLAIGRLGVKVLGADTNAGLLARAAENARLNALEDVCQFERADLFQPGTLTRHGPFDKILLDPPREGAIELVKSLRDCAPHRIAYISCDPATLARDASVLVHSQGFSLVTACVANMFPHTSHIESMAIFER